MAILLKPNPESEVESRCAMELETRAAQQSFMSEKDRAETGFDAAEWQEYTSIDLDSAVVFELDISTDGWLLATSDSAQAVRIVRVVDGELLHRFQDQGQPVACLKISPRGDILAGGGRDGKMWLWSIESGEVLHVLEWPEEYASAKAIAFFEGGKLVAAACRDDQLRIWNVADATLVAEHAFPAEVGTGRFFLDGTRLITYSTFFKSGPEPSGKVFQVKESGIELLASGINFTQPFAVRRDGALLASIVTTVLPRRRDLTLIDLANGAAVLHKIDLQDQYPDENVPGAVSLAIHPSDEFLAGGTLTGKVRFWSTRSCRLLDTVSVAEGSVVQVRFSENGKQMVIADTTGKLRICGTPPSEPIADPSREPVGIAASVDRKPNHGDPEAPRVLDQQREWTDITGAHKVATTFAGFDGDVVTLTGTDGREITLPIRRLSQQDQAFIREHSQSAQADQ